MPPDPPDREDTERAKHICACCGAESVEIGQPQGETRGDVFERSRQGCGYEEHRSHGDTYYESANN